LASSRSAICRDQYVDGRLVARFDAAYWKKKK
jgi:hypothetical protein